MQMKRLQFLELRDFPLSCDHANERPLDQFYDTTTWDGKNIFFFWKYHLARARSPY
jgi:hypothetical protein